jgi:hypothetical protein
MTSAAPGEQRLVHVRGHQHHDRVGRLAQVEVGRVAGQRYLERPTAALMLRGGVRRCGGRCAGAAIVVVIIPAGNQQ